MAALAYQNASVLGTAFATSAAGATGDTVEPIPNGALLVQNASGASVNVTVAVPGNDRYGSPRPDFVIAVGAGAGKLIGPFGDDLKDPSDERVHVSYSATASVTVAAISI